MFHYAGCIKITVSVNTYSSYHNILNSKTERVALTFYVQHYDRNGVGIDAALAAKVNLSGN